MIQVKQLSLATSNMPTNYSDHLYELCGLLLREILRVLFPILQCVTRNFIKVKQQKNPLELRVSSSQSYNRTRTVLISVITNPFQKYIAFKTNTHFCRINVNATSLLFLKMCHPTVDSQDGNRYQNVPEVNGKEIYSKFKW